MTCACGAELATYNKSGRCSTCQRARKRTEYGGSGTKKAPRHVIKHCCAECYADALPGSRLCGKPECAAKDARNKATTNKRGGWAGGPLPSFWGGGRR